MAVLAEEAARFGDGIARAHVRAGRDSGAEPVDVVAEDVDFSPAQTRFTLRWWGGAFDVETDLIGQFNVQNILCAATVALGLGVQPENVRQGIAEMQRRVRPHGAHRPRPAVPGRGRLRPFAREPGAGAGDAAPAWCPSNRPGRLISVFGCAGLRDRQKRKLMGRASGRLADYTVITAEDPRTEDLDAINREIEAGVREFADEQRILHHSGSGGSHRFCGTDGGAGRCCGGVRQGPRTFHVFRRDGVPVERPTGHDATPWTALRTRKLSEGRDVRDCSRPGLLVCSPEVLYYCAGPTALVRHSQQNLTISLLSGVPYEHSQIMCAEFESLPMHSALDLRHHLLQIEAQTR